MVVKKGKSIAVRSESIVEARFSLTPKQNELLDMLLCEIKDDDEYQYVISVDKYKSFYDTDTSNLYRDLKKAVKGFEGKGFRIINKETGEEIYYAWFSKIHYIPKIGEIRVNIDRDFKKLLWEVKKKIYYDIRNTLNFNSSYSQRMYYYLKSFEDTGWRADSVEKLLYKLECPKSYLNFGDFKRYVLDVSLKEINDKSDINFKYKTKKTGRKITDIMFYIKNKKQANKDEIKNEVAITEEKTDNFSYLKSKIRSLIKEDISDKAIEEILECGNNDIEFIKKQVEIMYRQKHIDSVVGWLKKALKSGGYEQPTTYSQIGLFNDFEQRQYDYDDLEQRLLGWK